VNQPEDSGMTKGVAVTGYVFKAHISRRMPDPTYKGAERHIMLVRAEDVPENLPRNPNPRNPVIDRGIYREVKGSLLNENGSPNAFHLKNKGITVIADEVKKINDGVFEVQIEQDNQGIVDGGHTYEVATTSKLDILSGRQDGKIEQYVKFEILTGVPRDLWPEIAGGLNTAVQVQTMSLANLRNEFDWIKELLKNEPYFDQIAFRENEDATYDIRDIIVILDAFNIEDFPNDGGNQPTRAYSNKRDVLQQYLTNPEKYRRLQPILKDVLRLYDYISYTARDLHNEAGGKGARLSFVDAAKRKKFPFPFIGKEGEYRLNRAALLPMVGAFRWMVQENGSSLEWRGGFERVIKVWEISAADLMRATQQTAEENNYKLTALGKSRNHWTTLHSIVARKEMNEMLIAIQGR
jgi:hypothetical protein